MKTKIVYSEKCLGYGTWHVEGPQRVKVAHDVLQARGYEFVEPTPADDWELLGVHDADYLFNLKKGLVEDSDTPAYDKIFEFARLSVGGALLASKINGFSLMRPPGHHVGRNGAALGAYTRGFCYLNNIAIAVKESGKHTLILDIDGHHGNGTQEIFQGDQKVVYVSLHQSPNYPGTGNFTEGNCINFALPGDSGGKRYLETLDKALGMVDLPKFEAVAVSAGFDTHQGDLATLGLVEQDYFEIGKRVALLKKPTFFVLEGGYVGEKVGLDIDSFLRGYEENL
ncbi:MAG: histone deacetylase [Candidatus Bathyarchaeota archaeon]|nr:histone deacetylase [Candidatus Bathyarchaeota archaeon]